MVIYGPILIFEFTNEVSGVTARSNLDVPKKLIDTVSGGRMINTQAVRLYVLVEKTCAQAHSLKRR